MPPIRHKKPMDGKELRFRLAIIATCIVLIWLGVRLMS